MYNKKVLAPPRRSLPIIPNNIVGANVPIHLDIPISIDWEEILLLSKAQPINSIDINRFCKKAE